MKSISIYIQKSSSHFFHMVRSCVLWNVVHLTSAHALFRNRLLKGSELFEVICSTYYVLVLIICHLRIAICWKRKKTEIVVYLGN